MINYARARFTVKALFCLYVLIPSLFFASCERESPVPFFSASGTGNAAPLIALSREAAKGFVEGSGCFLFAFPHGLDDFSPSQAIEVAIEITAAGESVNSPSADIKIAFLIEDDFEHPIGEGKLKLKNSVRELQKYGKGESLDETAILSASWAYLLECSGKLSVRIGAPSFASAAGFAILVSAPESANTSIISASSIEESSCGWLSEAEDGRVSWAGFPSEGGSISCVLDPSSMPSVYVPKTHLISILFKETSSANLELGGNASGVLTLSRGQRRATFRSSALNKEFGSRVSPEGGLSVFHPVMLGEGLGEIATVSGGEYLKGIVTLPAFPKTDGSRGGNAELLAFPDLEPITADPHGIIEWPQSAWRRPEREIFRWDRFPSVIVFDTVDYNIQDRYFRRLAFFTEKQGYKGKLLTDAELSGMHGFNAHDYSAESLAAFFSEAARLDFALSDEELELRGILLNNGIIRSSGYGTFIAGDGAIVSISRSSPNYLRYTLMAHEGFHAIYFIDESFREKVHQVYSSIDSRAKSFLQEYFQVVSSLGYDTSDTVLMENEFMAYLLQNRIDVASDYFSVNIADRYLRYGGSPMLAAHIKESNASDFIRAAEELSKYTFSRWGILAGRVGLQFWDD